MNYSSLFTQKNKYSLWGKQLLKYFWEINMTLSCFDYLVSSVTVFFLAKGYV